MQGWDQTGSNGANLDFPRVYGIHGPSIRDKMLVGLVNAAPYIGTALFGCWLSDPLNSWLGRRGTIFFSANFCLWPVLGSAFARSWMELLICRLLLGLGMGTKASTGEHCQLSWRIVSHTDFIFSSDLRRRELTCSYSWCSGYELAVVDSIWHLPWNNRQSCRLEYGRQRVAIPAWIGHHPCHSPSDLDILLSGITPLVHQAEQIQGFNALVAQTEEPSRPGWPRPLLHSRSTRS